MADQKATTYYDEAKKQELGEKHHAERREQNRKLRKEQEPTMSKVKRAVSGVRGAVAPAAKKVGEKVDGFIKERSIAIAHESRDIGTRRQNYGGSVMGGGDPFGVGGMGGGFGGGNPFASSRPEPAPRPRKRSKKRKSAPAPQRRSPPRQGGTQMFGVPKHMRWMF